MNIGILGYSGHAQVVLEAVLLNGHTLAGYAASDMAVHNPYEIEYLGNEASENFKGWQLCDGFVLGIGNNVTRTTVASYINQKGFQCVTIIHPDSSVSGNSKIGFGTFVARNVAINPMCNIGNNVIVNTSASIDHDCVIKDGAHIAPGAVLAGNVTIGARSFVGANSVIKEGINIGDDVTIGAGTVLVHDVLSGVKVVGNPAREL